MRSFKRILKYVGLTSFFLAPAVVVNLPYILAFLIADKSKTNKDAPLNDAAAISTTAPSNRNRATNDADFEKEIRELDQFLKSFSKVGFAHCAPRYNLPLRVLCKGEGIDDEVFADLMDRIDAILAASCAPKEFFLQISETSITRKSIDRLVNDPIIRGKTSSLAVGEEILFTDEDFDTLVKLVNLSKRLRVHCSLSTETGSALVERRLGLKSLFKDAPLLFDVESKRFL